MDGGHRGEEGPGLLCVANFGAGTGFAWTFIERLYADVAKRLVHRGIDTWVAYPEMDEAPETLSGSPARAVEQPVRLGDASSLRDVVDLVRRRNIEIVYLADRPTWHPAYAALRAAGVRWIVVHDHTSGARTRPEGLKRMVKWTTRRVPGMLADRVIGVSDFVARRKIEVDLVPPDRVERVWNAVEVPPRGDGTDGAMADRLGLPPARPVIACACRAAREKGVQHLLRAFARLLEAPGSLRERPVLVYMGTGPALEEWKGLVVDLGCGDDVVFAGYREDADELVGDAALAVVPSVWEEAFGLAALEPMARGVPVVASRVGGLPEVVADGETGLLVPPGDEEALVTAMRTLLTDEQRRHEMGRKGRERVEGHFSWDDQVARITSLLEEGVA